MKNIAQYFGIGVVSHDGTRFHILCTDSHPTVAEARACFKADPDYVQSLQRSWALSEGLRLCVIGVQITEHDLSDA